MQEVVTWRCRKQQPLIYYDLKILGNGPVFNPSRKSGPRLLEVVFKTIHQFYYSTILLYIFTFSPIFSPNMRKLSYHIPLGKLLTCTIKYAIKHVSIKRRFLSNIKKENISSLQK